MKKYCNFAFTSQSMSCSYVFFQLEFSSSISFYVFIQKCTLSVR